jgi:hypothetical protein
MMVSSMKVSRWLALAMVFAAAPRHVNAQASPPSRSTGCEFSGGPKSSHAWESGMAEGQGPATPVGRDVVVGRVFAVRSGEPVADARVRLDPGSRFAAADSTGRFAFPAVPQGRYRLTVMSFQSGSVSDSVTIGFDGLRVVAALSNYRGDIICVGPPRKPSNER